MSRTIQIFTIAGTFVLVALLLCFEEFSIARFATLRDDGSIASSYVSYRTVQISMAYTPRFPSLGVQHLCLFYLAFVSDE